MTPPNDYRSPTPSMWAAEWYQALRFIFLLSGAIFFASGTWVNIKELRYYDAVETDTAATGIVESDTWAFGTKSFKSSDCEEAGEFVNSKIHIWGNKIYYYDGIEHKYLGTTVNVDSLVRTISGHKTLTK